MKQATHKDVKKGHKI